MRRTAILVIALLAVTAGCSKPRRSSGSAAPSAPTPTDEVLLRSEGGAALPDDTPPDVIDAILRLPTQRASAVARLVAIGTAAEPAVTALLVSDNVEEVLGALEFFAQDQRAPVGAQVAEVLPHAVPSVRRQALLTLIALGAKAQVPAIEARLEDADSTVRTLAIQALTAMGAAQGSDALLGLLEDRDEQVTVEAAVALARSGDAATLGPRLVPLVKSPKAATAVGALTALRLLDAAVPADVLAAAAKDADDRVAMAALRLTPKAEGEGAAAIVTAALTDERPDVRRVAVETSSVLPAEARAAALATAVTDTSPFVRAAAVTELAAAASEADRVRTLVPWVQDADPDVRQAAVIALGRTSSEGVKPLLGRLATESDRAVLESLYRALTRLAAVEAVGPLVDVLANPEAKDHHLIAAALEAITGAQHGENIADWRAWLAAHPAPTP